jgi:hypothetical protein
LSDQQDVSPATSVKPVETMAVEADQQDVSPVASVKPLGSMAVEADQNALLPQKRQEASGADLATA